jgi:hypothetical protein
MLWLRIVLPVGFVLLLVRGMAGSSAPAQAQPAHQAPESIPRATVLASPAVVPLDLSTGQPVVEVRLNGRGPYRMFLDTGAGTTVLDDDLAKELGLAVLDTTRLGDPVNPQAIRADVVELDSISIGTARFERVRAVAWDRSTLRQTMPDKPRGVVGIGVFHDLVLSLDYPKQVLRLRRDVLPDADGARVLDYTSPHGIPVIPVRIGNRTYQAHLDSGSPGGFNLPLAQKDSLDLLGEVREIGRGRTANTELVIYGAQVADTARIGAHAFPQAMIQFNDELPQANLGGRVLREFVVTLDQKNRRVRFDRTGRVSAAPAPAPGAAPSPAPRTAPPAAKPQAPPKNLPPGGNKG